MSDYLIEMKDIVMEFGTMKALDHVNFQLKKGEVRGLVGKNGAGKSTLMKIIEGVYHQTSGEVFINGVEIPKGMPIKERSKTISMIFQEYSLAGELTVTQNIFLNFEPLKNGIIDDKTCIQRVQKFLDDIGNPIDPNAKVKDLSTGDMQLVEIAKAIIKNTSVILMDEPTAALDAEATKKFFQIVKRLKDSGYSIVISTHHLKDILKICDSVTVIRDGKVALDDEIGSVTLEKMIAAMLGNTLYESSKRKTQKRIERSTPILSVKNIISKRRTEPVSFDLFPGEVVGLAGLKGSGRTEIFNNLFGIDPITNGKITLNENSIQVKSPEKAIKEGIFLIPENRHTQGLSLMHSLYDNMLLPILNRIAKILVIDDKLGTKIVNNLIESLSIKTPDIKVMISQLSGGNQQKVVIGKALASRSKVMLMDDPMYGVDIHAKTEIADAIEGFTDEGNGILFTSSEVSELIENCDRILVIKNGQITEEIRDLETLTEDKLMAAIQ